MFRLREMEMTARMTPVSLVESGSARMNVRSIFTSPTGRRFRYRRDE